MSDTKTCPQCAAPATGSANCAYCGARLREIPTDEYLEDLRRFLRRHNSAISSHYSPWMTVSLLLTLGGPVGGYYAGTLYDWPWVTAIGVFLFWGTWFCIAIGKADGRYARKVFLPQLRALMAKKGYSADIVRLTGRPLLDGTQAEKLLEAIETL